MSRLTPQPAQALGARGGWTLPVGSSAATETGSETSTGTELADAWVTLVWNDPVNLMTYVTYVFQAYFGYDKPTAERLMNDVHTKGRAVVSTGTLEEMERDTEAMHGYGLWATFSKSGV